MKLRADKMDELAFLARDICHGAREQLAAEEDAKTYARMGRLWRATRRIAWLCLLLFGGIVCGAGLAAVARGDEVRAREPDARFVGCPSPCVLKIGATWCGPCHSERITAWLESGGWEVPAYDCDHDAEFCKGLGITRIPTFIVIRGGREVARYTGTDIKAFRPILKAACQ